MVVYAVVLRALVESHMTLAVHLLFSSCHQQQDLPGRSILCCSNQSSCSMVVYAVVLQSHGAHIHASCT